MGTRILVDLIHTHTQNPADHKLEWDNYDYNSIHAVARLFSHLRSHGYNWDVIRKGELSFDILQTYDILFINLLNEEDPTFTEFESEAIHRFLSPECGGSVFIIAEHTNCYRHAEKLNPLLKKYDIIIQYTSAIEIAKNCVAPLGWITISHFDINHPINRDIEKISFQLGGTLKTSHGTAFLSEHGYGDYWNPNLSPNFVGDKRLTLDADKEPRGCLPVVACLENIGGNGGGRLVVVADQNIYGDIWIHYYDNFKHALNIFEWLGHKTNQTDTPLRNTIPAGINIAFDSYYSKNTAGRTNDSDYYSFFVNMNRDPGISAHVIETKSFSNNSLKTMQVLVFPTLRREIKNYSALLQLLTNNASMIIVIMFELRTTSLPTLKLIAKLAPDFNIAVEKQKTTSILTTENLVSVMREWRSAPRITSNCKLHSTQIQVEDLQLYNYNYACVTSDWGDPLLETKGEVKYDIARIKNNIIIYFQDEMFRNGYLGTNEARHPGTMGMAAVHLQHRLIEYLKKICSY